LTILIADPVQSNAMRNLISEQDAKILGELLATNGEISAQKLSEDVGISANTARERREKLTEKYLRITYDLALERYGWRQVMILVKTSKGRTIAIGEELLKHKQVIFVGRTIGQFSIDLEVDVLIRSDKELADLLEKVRTVDGVRDAIWMEVIEVIGNKTPPPQLDTHEATLPNM
jgi:DNA-binding Lrp family transcriptional regulator